MVEGGNIDDGWYIAKEILECVEKAEELLLHLKEAYERAKSWCTRFYQMRPAE